MTLARTQQVSVDHTPYYHCTSRCVRRAYLCGVDRYSRKSFEHRRQWIESRLRMLSEVFSLEILAYAIMSNHYHVVVCLNPNRANSWTDIEVLSRWSQLYAVSGNSSQWIETYRERLGSLSWFMRAINEPIARRANCEDDCKGRFWEGRFKSQALLDESALLRCLAYVDLNPIRAGIARTPEASMYTSVKARIDGRDQHLQRFADSGSVGNSVIPMPLTDYLQLLDWTGRAMHPKKRGAIPASIPGVLSRLNLDGDGWLREMRYYGKWYYRAVGSVRALREYCSHLGQSWVKGIGCAQHSHALHNRPG
jgi:REP-associated tyrosine transposase